MNSASQDLQQEIQWFSTLVDVSMKLYFKHEISHSSVYELAPPDLQKSQSTYAQLVNQYNLSFEERLVLILSLLPKLQPQVLDLFQLKNKNTDVEFVEFGGRKSTDKLGFIPTLETACFLLGGYQIEERFRFIQHFTKHHLFFSRGILELNAEEEFSLNQVLGISEEYFGLFSTGKKVLPQYSSRFPAKEISTKLNWEDLIVNQGVKDDLVEIQDWIAHSSVILMDWNFQKTLKKGYRTLFYGVSGTGKTLAATLIGKTTHQPVFRVDLSMVVSKYIGETEKNLGRLFDEAENKSWILFFDEADALFGKRTQTKGANDRYANQEVAYLLQRIEDFSGLVILATNLSGNIDEAFSRRFQSRVYFPKPDVEERLKLWENMFAKNFDNSTDVDYVFLAKKYTLTGGEMINVLRYCALEAAKRQEKKIYQKDIIRAIQKEYYKSNKTI